MKSLESRSLVVPIVSVVLALAAVVQTETEAGSLLESSPSKIVTGEVAQVEGKFHMAKNPQGEVTLDVEDKFYVITSQAGEQMRLELDDNTKVRKRVNPGDKIEATISPKGHTLSVTRIEP